MKTGTQQKTTLSREEEKTKINTGKTQGGWKVEEEAKNQNGDQESGAAETKGREN